MLEEGQKRQKRKRKEYEREKKRSKMYCIERNIGMNKNMISKEKIRKAKKGTGRIQKEL